MEVRGSVGAAEVRMLDAAGAYLEANVLPPEEARASAGVVVGLVTFASWALIGVVLLVEIL